MRHSSYRGNENRKLATNFENRSAAFLPHNMARTRTSVPLSLLRAAPRQSGVIAGASRRTLATVQDAPKPVAPARKTTHGGLSDQDRIFSNLQMRGDHGLKGAMVSLFSHLLVATRDRLVCIVGWLWGLRRHSGGARGSGGAQIDSIAFDWRDPHSDLSRTPHLLPSLLRPHATPPRPPKQHKVAIEFGSNLLPTGYASPIDSHNLTRLQSITLTTTPCVRNEETGTERKTSFSKATTGSFSRSKTPLFEVEEVLDSRPDSSGPL